MTLILALGIKERQRFFDFKTILIYQESSWIAEAIHSNPVLKSEEKRTTIKEL